VYLECPKCSPGSLVKLKASNICSKGSSKLGAEARGSLGLARQVGLGKVSWDESPSKLGWESWGREA
jgi:hypothetical protein